MFFLFIICLLLWLCCRSYVGRKKIKPVRSLFVFSAFFLSMFSLTGCSQSDSNEFSYNLLGDTSQGENSNYTVELDMVENTITATNKVTGKTILLTRDPFDQYGSISSIYVDENACYYTTQGNVGDGFEIYKINLKN